MDGIFSAIEESVLKTHNREFETVDTYCDVAIMNTEGPNCERDHAISTLFGILS